jgi:hypothetical protein
VKAAKRIAIFLLVYAGFVAVFESIVGYVQSENEGTLVLTTSVADGIPIDRVLAHLESDGQLYVSAHHWPRAWYNRALENPEVQVTLDGVKTDHLAVPVTGEEYDRFDRDNRIPVRFRILMGFAPRSLLRLDPR